MKKTGLLILMLAGLTAARAQTISGGGNFAQPQPGLLDAATASPTPAETPGPKADAAKSPAPTTIDSQAMDYDEKTRVAIFTGEHYGVVLVDPQFKVNCGKLTAYMRKAGGTAAGATGAKGKASPAPSASPAGKADAAAQKASGLQRAVAEGSSDEPVVIVQDKPATNGDQPQHNVGIAVKADYNADTGDVYLTGWPRVSQGINTQIATSEKTVMIMN